MQYEIRFYKLYILYIKKACWIQTKVWMSIFFCPKTHPITPKVFRPNSVRNLQGFGNLEGFVLLLETVKRFGNLEGFVLLLETVKRFGNLYGFALLLETFKVLETLYGFALLLETFKVLGTFKVLP